MEEENPRPTGDVHHEHKPASTTELMESAKMVAGAAQSAAGGKMDSIDKVRVAGAAEDLLEAAEKYGKLEGSGVGTYLDKAEEYLHNYHSSDSRPAGDRPEGEGHAPVSGDRPEGEGHAPVSGERREEENEEKESGGGGGVGAYVNMAKGFFK